MRPHGTTTRYVSNKCRCDLCRAAWSDYLKDYRSRRKMLSTGALSPTRTREPDRPLLDTAVSKVGQDFPSIGALLRLSWTGAA